MRTRVPEPSGEGFYAELPVFAEFSEALDPGRYVEAPPDWLVVVTDVLGSTRAIEEGRYKDVNALGVASIVAVGTAMRAVDLPYVFGGDGATLLVPGSRRAALERALRGLRQTAGTAFGLSMRAGVVPVDELYARGTRVGVARLAASPATFLAMFAGSGFALAEVLVKDPATGPRYAVGDDGPAEADFSGFQCRWQPISSRRGQMVSLLVRALDPDPAQAAQIYTRLMRALGDLLQGGDGRLVAPESLQLAATTQAFLQEAGLRTRRAPGFLRWLYQFAVRAKMLVGRLLLARRLAVPGFDGKRYRMEVTENTDFHKLDETLRMVLDLTQGEKAALLSVLEDERGRGSLVYGVHFASAALMTCAIDSYDREHVHFVDGADGGYALAAKQMKAQLAGQGRG